MFLRKQKKHQNGMDSVKIIVKCPLTQKTLYTYFTTKDILCVSPIFKEWFKAVKFIDFIEIGDEGYSGLSNLMLINKNGKFPYLLTVNCERYAHKLGCENPPIIKKIIDYLSGIKVVSNDLFDDCKRLLKIPVQPWTSEEESELIIFFRFMNVQQLAENYVRTELEIILKLSELNLL